MSHPILPPYITGCIYCFFIILYLFSGDAYTKAYCDKEAELGWPSRSISPPPPPVHFMDALGLQPLDAPHPPSSPPAPPRPPPEAKKPFVKPVVRGPDPFDVAFDEEAAARFFNSPTPPLFPICRTPFPPYVKN